MWEYRVPGSKTPGGYPVKRHRGEPGHTRDTRAHAGTRITRTNLTTIHPKPTTHPHENRDRLNSRKNSCKPGVDRSPRPTQTRPPPSTGTVCSSKSYTNLNRGQDTRANRTQHTTSSSISSTSYGYGRQPIPVHGNNELMMPIDSSNTKQGQITTLHSSTHDHGR